MSTDLSKVRVITMESKTSFTDIHTEAGEDIADGVEVDHARRITACLNAFMRIETADIEELTTLGGVAGIVLTMRSKTEAFRLAHALLSDIEKTVAETIRIAKSLGLPTGQSEPLLEQIRAITRIEP